LREKANPARFFLPKSGYSRRTNGSHQHQKPKDEEITFFGETDFRGKRERFGVRRKDRRHHMHIIGKTGMGKSTLLRTLIASDLKEGNGLALVDPHGDLAEAVIRDFPESR